MDPTFRHRYFGGPTTTTESTGDELSEDDVLWTTDPITEQDLSPSPITSTPTHRAAAAFNFDRKSGILAALPYASLHRTVLYRKPSLPSSSSRPIPSIPPRPSNLMTQSVPSAVAGRKINQSAPMNVPVLSVAMARERISRLREGGFDDVGDDDIDENGDVEMLPPHEIVARGSHRSPRTAHSVLEGVGRTLKGRDLRQVRNAIWRQTGFLD